jgi:TonB family protein
MKILLLIFGLFLVSQGDAPSGKWECGSTAEKFPDKEFVRLKPAEVKMRVVKCVVPRLPGSLDANGTVLIDMLVDEEGNVQCLKVISGGFPLTRQRAMEAARQWKFQPLIIDGKTKPFSGLLFVTYSWDIEEANKQCPKGTRK